MSPTTRPLRPRRTAAVILVALSLTGISACSISVGGGSTDQGTAAAAGQEGSPSEQPASSSPSTTATTASQAPRSQAATPSNQEQTSPAAVGSSAPEAGAQPASGERPGARATITDSDWLSDLDSVDRTVSATPAMLLDKGNDRVRIEGDVENLTISGDNVTVFVDYVALLTITGTNADVYVKDVDRVVIKGTNADVVWAGNTPTVEDFGRNTGTRQQGSEG